MHIEIDPYSGFCFGVQKAISKVEELSSELKEFNCLGDIVHNRDEVERLAEMGMKTITKDNIGSIHNEPVLIRSHGEPPSTYSSLEKNNNQIIDATCPVVLKLQARIKKSYTELQAHNGQLVIFGKKAHAEVIGLNGQTGDRAIVITDKSDLQLIDFNRPVEVYSQTTMSLDAFREISAEIKQQAKAGAVIHDTICRQVANRVPKLRSFATQFDVILFVSGKKSSNGKFLYEVCKSSNSNTHFISSPEEIKPEWVSKIKSVGICGATSTPLWQMEKVEEYLNQYFPES